MIWLVSQMWMALSGAAILGLLFGWSFRGFLLNGKTRRAIGERDVAKTELEHAKSEIEELYAVQRRAGDGGVVADDATLRRELDLREAKLTSLSEELTKSKNELAKLKTVGGAVAGSAALAGGAVTALATGGAASADPVPQPTETMVLDDASLEWRNRYLQSRVRKLEGDLDTARTSTPEVETEAAGDASGAGTAAIAGAGAATAAVVAAVSGDEAPVDTVAQDKLRWQNDYLRQRLSFFETQAEAAPVATAAVAPVLEAAPVLDDTVEAETDAPLVEGEESPEQEMARLRWRNRYLESRIAYYEGGDEAGEAEADEGASGLGGAAVAAGAAAITAGVAALAGDAEAEAVETIEEAVETVTESIPEIEEVVEEAADPSKGYWDTEPAPAAAEPEEDTVTYEETVDADLEGDAPEFETIVEAEAEVEEVDEAEEDVSADEVLVADADEDVSEGTVEAEDTEPEVETEDASGDDEIEADADDEGELAVETDPEPVGIQPASLSGPVDGEADDLTAIGGIGPKIADVMNDLGIYHYDQIAAWTPENAEWIDEYLNFDGRVDREKWIDQAKILSDV